MNNSATGRLTPITALATLLFFFFLSAQLDAFGQTWTTVANEGGTFNTTGELVRYGNGTSFIYGPMAGYQLPCTSRDFGNALANLPGKICQTTAASSWTQVAAENEAIRVLGDQVVRFGTGSSWVYMVVGTGSPLCVPSQFGFDPAPYMAKVCQIAPGLPQWTFRVFEGTKFAVRGTVQLRYGTNSSWVGTTVTNSAVCSNSFFGRDPAPTFLKQCDILTQAPVAVTIGTERQQLTVGYGQTVLYTANGQSTRKVISGTFLCDNTTFSDPAPAFQKECQILNRDAAGYGVLYKPDRDFSVDLSAPIEIGGLTMPVVDITGLTTVDGVTAAPLTGLSDIIGHSSRLLFAEGSGRTLQQGFAMAGGPRRDQLSAFLGTPTFATSGFAVMLLDSTTKKVVKNGTRAQVGIVTGVGGVTATALFVSRFWAQEHLRANLVSRGVSDDAARWASVAFSSFVVNAVTPWASLAATEVAATFITKYSSDRRKLLDEATSGTLCADPAFKCDPSNYFYQANQLYDKVTLSYVNQTTLSLNVPPFDGHRARRIYFDYTVPLTSFQRSNYVIYENSLQCANDPNCVFSAVESSRGSMSEYPYSHNVKKMVSDGARVWILVGEAAPGSPNYAIYSTDQVPLGGTNAPIDTTWTQVDGGLVDIHPGPNYAWGISADSTIFNCRQPCSGSWTTIGGQATNIALDVFQPNVPVKVWVKQDWNGSYSSRAEDASDMYTAQLAANVPNYVKAYLDEAQPRATYQYRVSQRNLDLCVSPCVDNAWVNFATAVDGSKAAVRQSGPGSSVFMWFRRGTTYYQHLDADRNASFSAFSESQVDQSLKDELR